MPEKDKLAVPEKPLSQVTGPTQTKSEKIAAEQAKFKSPAQEALRKYEAPKGYRTSKWYDEYQGSEQRVRNVSRQYNIPDQTVRGVSPSDPHMEMENYDKLSAVERGMGGWLPTKVQQGKELLDAFLPGNIEKGVYKAGGWVIKAMSIFDAAGEFVERGSGLVRQQFLAEEAGEMEEFTRNLGNAWAAGSLFYDVANAPMIRGSIEEGDLRMTFHTDLPSTSELPKLRKRITELTDQGIGRKAALEQVKSEYMNDIGALSIRAAKQDLLGHVLLDPFMWLTIGGYAPVDIIKGTATTARASKYSVSYLDELADMAKIAEAAGDSAKAAEYTEAIAIITRTMKPITAGDKAAMFITGEFPEPLAGASKIDETLYFFGNTLAQSETKAGKLFNKLNPFSLTPSARASDWQTRIDDYIGTHVLSSGDPYKVTDDLVELASQATSGRISAIAATADGRVVQSYLRASELSAKQLLNDFRTVADDGALLMRIESKLNIKSPDLIDSILAGKGDDIAKQLSRLDDEGAELAALLTKDKLDLLGQLKGQPYTEELFGHILHNNILDEMAQIGIVKFGIKQRGLIEKWTAFMKAGETMAFLRMNPTFAAKNWINNEFTMIARGVGGGFFGREDDLLKLVDKLNFSPLRASQAWTMAGMAGGELGDIGSRASQTIAKQLQGDAIFLDKWAKSIQKADLGIFDFGKLAQRAERTASQRAMVKGYTRAWRKFWKPGGFTNASKFLPQNVIRELGEDAVAKLDNILQGAGSMDDIDNIFANLNKIDLSSSSHGVVNNVEKKLGIDLGTQFEEFEVEAILDDIGRALDSGSPREVEKVFDDIYDRTIKNITEDADAALSTKLQKFEQVAEAERSMALLDVTEEITNQLDIANYTYSVGMARFRPMDVSKEVRDAYWPIWLKQQNQHFDNVYKRIDAAIEGVSKGGKNIDLNLDQALRTFDDQKKVWGSFFEKRNVLYEASKEQGWTNWDEIVEEIDGMYIAASNSDLDIIKKTDDLMTAVIRKNNPDLAEGFAGWRKSIRDWKLKDRAQTRSYTYAQKKGELPTDAPTYSGFWKERGGLHEELGNIKQRGYNMMEGDQSELARFSQASDTLESFFGDSRITNEFLGIGDDVSPAQLWRGAQQVEPGAVTGGDLVYGTWDKAEANAFALKAGEAVEGSVVTPVYFNIRNPKMVTSGEITNLYGENGKRLIELWKAEGFDGVVDIEGKVVVSFSREQAKIGFQSTVSDRLAKQLALDLDGKSTTLRAGQAMGSELGPTFPNEMKEEQWFSRNFFTIRELEEETLSQLASPVTRLDDISDISKGELNKFFTNAKREMADAQYGSIRMAEYSRDAALLNYNRKMNYDTWLGTFMPYEFWMTHTMGQWAIQSLNRPGMMAFYHRIRTLQDRVAGDDSSFPTRLKGKMRINIPGLPDWMGDAIYLDPMNIALPFGQMTMPYQLVKQKALSREGAVERELNRMAREGEITQEQAVQALATQDGPIFRQALATADSGGEGQTDNWELLSAMSSPHAPYDIAYKALSGQPENIGPFLPATYTVTRLLGMFGVDLPHEKANAAARLRRRMGLPGFDQWEDYRVERMLTNLSATGDITPDQAARALIEHEGPAWEMARSKAAKEYAGGPWWSTMLKTLGAPTFIYPEGEYLQRELGKEFGVAIEAYEAGDNEAYNDFFDKNPEFANRLSLWDSPQERMQNFLVDEIWNKYNDMPTINKNITRDALGDEFMQRFMSKETRNYQAIPIEQMQMWLKMMGGDPPGTLTEAFPIDFAPPEVANQAQIFYDTRNENFPDFYEMQNEYFDLAENSPDRKTHPVNIYWKWQRDFLKRNPSIAAYIDDNFEPQYATVEEMKEARQEEPTFILPEWEEKLGISAVNILLDAYNTDFVPPQDIINHLTEQANELGMTYEELVEEVGTSR